MRGRFEPCRGEPAFDPEEVARIADLIRMPEDAVFEDPLLERVVRNGLAHIETTFQGDHPKYGVGTYAREEHDGFPPTIISAVDALTLWGMTAKAERLFGYWLENFVRPDGTIRYYGPSLSEYGQLLTSGLRMMERGCGAEWLKKAAGPLGRIAAHLQCLVTNGGRAQLAPGIPEADESAAVATYFHNNAWIVRGLKDWANLPNVIGSNNASGYKQCADALREVLLEAIGGAWPGDQGEWWLRPTVEAAARPENVTASRLGSYTNYRYWPELLSSGALPRNWMERIVKARLDSGGQFCGVTRFEDRLDDWPLMNHMEGLLALGMADDFRLCLWGHIHLHQAEGHLTAYEQVSLPPGRRAADYCLPCQLTAARALGRLRISA